MTQEDKELLLKDLSARLPYGVKVCYTPSDYYYPIGKIWSVRGVNLVSFIADIIDDYGHPGTGQVFENAKLEDIKPYLRPMSSMTEEEYQEYGKACDLDCDCSSNTLRTNLKAKSRVLISVWHHGVDWLNAHHFDYRGLIEKGLALEAPEGMYKTE